MFLLNKISARMTKLALSISAITVLNTLCITAYAMESISDQALSDVTGADGVAVTVQADKFTFGSLYWEDQIDNSGTVRRLQLDQASAANQVTLTPGSTTNPLITAKVNAGSSGTTPALSLNLNIAPFTFYAPRVEVCTATVCPANSLGAFGLQTTQNSQIALATTNGLFNSAGTASVTILLDGVNTFFTSNGNQIVGADIRANISSTNGRIWIDATDGLRFGGDIALKAASASRAGIQASLMLQTAQSGSSLNTVSPTAGGLVRLGISGNVLNTNLYVRGAKGTTANEDTIGALVGNQGLAARLTGQVQSGALNADGTGTGFQLEFGGVGTGSSGYGIQMTNFVPFSNVSTGTNPTFDSGNIYLNLISASTLTMPVQCVFTVGSDCSPTKAAYTPVNVFNLTAADFTQPVTADSVYIGVRGLNIQGVPLQTYFYQNGVGRVTSGAVPGFALMPVLNNVNANLTLNAASATTLGYTLAVSTQGTNGQTGEVGNNSATEVKTTSLFLADTSTPSKAQYIGLRNINLFLEANGVIQINDTSTDATCATHCIKLTLPNFLLALSGDLAAGYLPGAEPANFAKFSDPANKDKLYGLNVKLKGATNSSTNNIGLSTTSTGALGLNADLTLNSDASSFIRLVEPSGSALGLDGLTGRIQLGSGSQISVNATSGTFTNVLNINPGNVAGGELLGTLNFYPNGGSANPVGKIVMTGGQIISNLTVAPVLR